MEAVGLPKPLNDNTEYVQHQLRYPRHEQLQEYNTRYNACNPDQKGFVHFIRDKGNKRPVMIHAAAGFGKSFAFKTVAARERMNGGVVVIIASTGLAALSFDGGRTPHAAFKMTVVEDPTTEEIVCDFGDESDQADFLRQVTLILWDEAPMAHRGWMEAISTKLCQIMENELPFGGKQFILAGDFRQLPTVVKGGSHQDVYSACIASSPLWRHFDFVGL